MLRVIARITFFNAFTDIRVNTSIEYLSETSREQNSEIGICAGFQWNFRESSWPKDPMENRGNGKSTSANSSTYFRAFQKVQPFLLRLNPRNSIDAPISIRLMESQSF